MLMNALPRLTALRYVQPLREGGSLPAIVDTEDGLFVLKFRGAGQGPKALVAELIVGMIARELGLPTPDLALVHLADEFGVSEPDPEIQDLLRASHGTNVALRFLDGAFNFDPTAAGDLIDPDFAAGVVWLDAFCTNVDRTHRNPNLLIWERKPWLIDHGAALYAHHNWSAVDEARTRTRFPLIAQHVLLLQSERIEAFDSRAAAILTPGVIGDILQQVPDSLLDDPAAERNRYHAWLTTRIQAPRDFTAEAVSARERAAATPSRPLRARR
jgi:hypothetical protein